MDIDLFTALLIAGAIFAIVVLAANWMESRAEKRRQDQRQAVRNKQKRTGW